MEGKNTKNTYGISLPKFWEIMLLKKYGYILFNFFFLLQ